MLQFSGTFVPRAKLEADWQIVHFDTVSSQAAALPSLFSRKPI
jgi:hypothetical protein